MFQQLVEQYIVRTPKQSQAGVEDPVETKQHLHPNLCVPDLRCEQALTRSRWPRIFSTNVGTGMDIFIASVRVQEGKGKKTFPKFGIQEQALTRSRWSRIFSTNFGNGNEYFHCRNSGMRREWQKNIPKVREQEGGKIHSHNSRTWIRGFHSQEWTAPVEYLLLHKNTIAVGGSTAL